MNEDKIALSDSKDKASSKARKTEAAKKKEADAEKDQLKDEQKATQREKRALALATAASVAGAKAKEDEEVAAADDAAAAAAEKKMSDVTAAASAADSSVSATERAMAVHNAAAAQRAAAQSKDAQAKAAAMARNNLNGAEGALNTDKKRVDALNQGIAGDKATKAALTKKAHVMGERAIKAEKRAQLEAREAKSAKKVSDSSTDVASKAVAAAKKLAEEIAAFARSIGGSLQDDVKEAGDEEQQAHEFLTKAEADEKFANSVAGGGGITGSAAANVRKQAEAAVGVARKRAKEAAERMLAAETKLKNKKSALADDKEKVASLNADAKQAAARAKKDQQKYMKDADKARTTTQQAKKDAELAAGYTKKAKAASHEATVEMAELGEEKVQLETLSEVVDEDKKTILPIA